MLMVYTAVHFIAAFDENFRMSGFLSEVQKKRISESWHASQNKVSVLFTGLAKGLGPQRIKSKSFINRQHLTFHLEEYLV